MHFFTSPTILISPLLAIALILLVLKRKQRNKAKRLRRESKIWSIGIYEGTDPLTFSPATGVLNPIITALDITDIKARFVADPFMLWQNGAWHLFFEVLNNDRNKGEIGYAQSPDLVTWEYGGIVLKEKFHLSYPYVFAHEGETYMIPECAKSNAVRLYRASGFPIQWDYVAPLIQNKSRHAPLIDPSIVRHNSHWYLFSYARKLKNLHLFTAETLTGSWKEHPASPIVTASERFSRPAGRIVSNEDCLYRYAQDDNPRYGSKVWAFKITELTPESYHEEPCPGGPVVGVGSAPWHNAGMHNVDPHRMKDGRWFAIVDGLEDKQIK